jgi:membrane-associated phospholipid phosphatase
VDLTLGLERGNTVMLGLALHTRLDRITTPKVNDPPRVPVAQVFPQQSPDWKATARDLAQQTDWHVRSIEQRGPELRVTIDDPSAVYWRERIDRAAAVLHRDAPRGIERFVFVHRERGLDVAEHLVDRATWIAQKTRALPPGEQRETMIARAPQKTSVHPSTARSLRSGRTDNANDSAALRSGRMDSTDDSVLRSGRTDGEVYESRPDSLETGLRLGFSQTIGGPDSFLLYQIYAEQRARLNIRDDTWLQGALRVRLVDNYDQFKFTAPSNLPRVRTFLREYMTSSTLTMPNLTAAHVGKLNDDQYYSVYGGYLEEMFGGVGGEWLYRPFASRVAFGVDVNEVKQRDFQQDFGFRDYRTATGHATLYWDTGWNDVLATVHVGRYLAGDFGATLNLSRVFKNGVTIGAFATKTNVSAAQFGEGSFDKGIYLSIPYDAMFSRTSGTVANFVWKPLTRDGGAMLARSVSLYNLTSPRSDRTLKTEPAPLPNDEVMPADRKETWQPQSVGPEPYTRITPKPPAGTLEGGTSHEYRLMEALYRQDFRNIKVEYDGSRRLTVSLANDRIRPISRAVGRAARTALRLAPADAREIRIIYAERVAPAAIYDFFDLKRLERYFDGEIKRSDLSEYITVEYLNPAAREKDPLARLDDLDPAADTPLFATLVPEPLSVGRVIDDYVAAGRAATDVNWLTAGAIGAGVVLGSSVLDNRAFRFARDHKDSAWIKNGVRVGNALPWLGLAASGLIALDGSDPRRSRTGFAAAEAGVTALFASTGLKYVVGRARPDTGLGNHSFEYFSSGKRFDAFPSRHTSVAWAVATPFALEYDAPWLYGLAAVSNLARIGSRDHWVSDTVAGSVLGYGIGRIFWESSRSRSKYAPRVLLTPDGVNFAWETY